MEGPKEGQKRSRVGAFQRNGPIHHVYRSGRAEESSEEAAVLARCSFRSIALLAPIGNGVGLLVQVQSMRFKSDTRKGD